MSIALGMYTELAGSSPSAAFSRVISLVYKPVLSFLYNNPGTKFSMYQSAAVMKYLSQSYPEVNMLIAALAKRSDLELVTGTYSQAILSLNPPKDRSMQIERMTTLIRRYYGIKASSCFFYGQIWAPSFIHSLRNTGISSVVISAYRATTREKVATSSFVMNELGKRVDMRIISDEGAQLFSRYAQSEITLDELESGLMNVMDTSDDDVVFFSIDQMLEGSARQGDDERISDVLIRIISHRRGCLLSDIPCERPGYLDSGWYGRDAYAQGLYSFNDIFVRNENFRYLLNRYIALSETVSQFKKDRNAKREAEADLFHVSIGPLFIHDAQCTPMRQAERRSFWKAIIEAEESLLDSDSQALKSEYDYEEIGMNDYAARGKMFNAVFSPKGGAVAELCYKPLALNIIDTRVPFDISFPHIELNKTFSDSVHINGRAVQLASEIFDSEVVSRTRGEYQFTYASDSFTLIKHFRMRSQTLILESTIIPEEDVTGSYTVYAYLSMSDMILTSSDQRRQMMLGSLDDVRTVRYTENLSGLTVSFSSTEPFSVAEEKARQSQNTSIGNESFELYTKLSFSFPIEIKKGEARTIRFILRASDSRKDRE